MIEEDYNEVFTINKRTRADADLNNNSEDEPLTVHRKQAKAKGPDMQPTVRAVTPAEGQSNEHLPQAPKSRAPQSSAGLRKLRGMAGQQSWNAATFL